MIVTDFYRSVRAGLPSMLSQDNLRLLLARSTIGPTLSLPTSPFGLLALERWLLLRYEFFACSYEGNRK